MIITNKKYGDFSVCLVDDGTIGTVIEIYMVDAEIETKQEIRYPFTENGTMTDDGFIELAEDALKVYIELYLV